VDNVLIQTYICKNIKLRNYRHSMWFESTDEWNITDWRWYDTALNDDERTELYEHGDYPSILYNLSLVEPNDIAADNIPEIHIIKPEVIE